MATKMKGLLRGLRYISNIFEAEEKEQEMQIGFPTDVKHVAHIGWDGPSVSSPSWMNELKLGSSEPPTSAAVAAARSEPKISPKSPSRDVNGVGRSSSRDLPAMPLPKPSKRNPSSSAAGANSDSPRTSRHSRRHQSSVASPDRDKSESSRGGRRERSAATGSDMSNYASSSLQEQAAATKQRRRKIKGSSSSGSGSSSRASRSKAVDGKATEKELPVAKATRDDEDEEEG